MVRNVVKRAMMKERVGTHTLFIFFILDKTIKLWKVFEKSLKVVAENSVNGGPQPVANALRIPKLAHQDTIIAAAPRKVYANGKKSKP
jgi:serine/threonine-protein phosphatase 2A regulatory subunit B